MKQWGWNASSWASKDNPHPEDIKKSSRTAGVDDLEGVIEFYKQHGLEDTDDLESSEGSWPVSSDDEGEASVLFFDC